MLWHQLTTERKGAGRGWQGARGETRYRDYGIYMETMHEAGSGEKKMG